MEGLLSEGAVFIQLGQAGVLQRGTLVQAAGCVTLATRYRTAEAQERGQPLSKVTGSRSQGLGGVVSTDTRCTMCRAIDRREWGRASCDELAA